MGTKVQAVKLVQKVLPVLSVHWVQWVKKEKKVQWEELVTKVNEVSLVHQAHRVHQVLLSPFKVLTQSCSNLLENDEEPMTTTSEVTSMILMIFLLFQITLKVSKKCSPL